MRKNKGFSLIELLIVVAIILIIAAIAIPNLLRSRIAANEASAVGSIRSINTAEVTYSSTYPDTGFSADLASLGGDASTCATAADKDAACLIDSVLASGTKSGYTFTYTQTAGDTGPSVAYSVVGKAVAQGQSGQRSFYSDQSGVIRFAPDDSVDSTSAPLQ